MWMDSHVHYDHKKFDKDRKEVLQQCVDANLAVAINPAISFESNVSMRKVLQDYPWIYYGVGIHPMCVGEYDRKRDHFWLDELSVLATKSKVVAIGETGLDYHKECSEAHKEQQEFWFRNLLELAQKKKLPLILHIREADEKAIEILREYPLKESGVVHCFSSDWKHAQIYIEEMGLYLGIGGKVTYPEQTALREAVQKMPLDRLLVETDSPFVIPEGCTEKRNSSIHLDKIIKTIAQLKGISEQEVEQASNRNVKRLFCVQEHTQKPRIFLTGDTHCRFERIASFCERMETTKDDIMIILGDAGVNYSGLFYDVEKKDFIDKIPITLFCVHGNHEERPQNIPVYEEQIWHGGTVYVEPEYPNILFAKDGERYDFQGKKAIVIGGAYSVDRMWRVIHGYPWWKDEQPSEEIKSYVEQQLEACGWNVDYVLTHTVPLKYEPVEVFLSGIDQRRVDKATEQWLDGIEDKLTYEKWYAGHYHTKKEIDNLILMFEDYRVLGD